MKIERKSLWSGKVRVMDIPVTEAQLAAWESGQYIQDAMPNISAGEREFIMTGVTPEEWESMFAEED
jgi:hypothetical protein